jgi:hypothetical protein
MKKKIPKAVSAYMSSISPKLTPEQRKNLGKLGQKASLKSRRAKMEEKYTPEELARRRKMYKQQAEYRRKLLKNKGTKKS